MGPLSTLDAGFRAFLGRVSAGSGQYRLVARNFLLDQGILPARCESYRDSGAVVDHADRKSWRSQHEKYLTQRVFRPGPPTGIPPKIDQADEDICPETFRLVAPDSPFAYSDKALHLVRTEELSFVSRLSGVGAERLKELARDVVQHGAAAPGYTALDGALRSWTKRMELRPVFTAFWEDLSDMFGDTPDSDPDGWANRLRDRLGLAHLDPVARGGSIDVLIFRYPVGSLAQIHELGADVRALVPPTVLDGTFSDAFCPAPLRATTGYTLDLSGDLEDPRREALHPTFAFEAAHLWRVGTVDAAVDLSSLETLRGLHLMWLRDHCGVADYAHDTDGDLK